MQQSIATTETVLTTFLQHLGNQNADGIAECFAEEIDWYVPGDPALPWVGPRSHQTEVANYFRTMWPHFVPGKSTANVEKLIISGNDAVMLGTFSHTVESTGKTFQTGIAMHLIVVEGKIVRMHLYEDTWVVSKAFN